MESNLKKGEENKKEEEKEEEKEKEKEEQKKGEDDLFAAFSQPQSNIKKLNKIKK